MKKKTVVCTRPSAAAATAAASAGIIIPLNIIQATSSTRGNEEGERVERQKK